MGISFTNIVKQQDFFLLKAKTFIFVSNILEYLVICINYFVYTNNNSSIKPYSRLDFPFPVSYETEG